MTQRTSIKQVQLIEPVLPLVSVNGHQQSSHLKNGHQKNNLGKKKEPFKIHPIDPDTIDWESIITEDDTPVDNYETFLHYVLFTSTLHDSTWQHSRFGKQFIVAADVGIFYDPNEPAIVPDVFLSFGVTISPDQTHKRYRSYFLWEVLKPPEVVIELVSNKKGKEEGKKKTQYAELGILYYIVHDPLHRLSKKTLRLYRLQDGEYVEQEEKWMPEVELGVTLWRGSYQGLVREYLRWCDRDGNVILNGKEVAEQAQAQAEQAQAQAEQAQAQAEQAQKRAEYLHALLRKHGIEETDL